MSSIDRGALLESAPYLSLQSLCQRSHGQTFGDILPHLRLTPAGDVLVQPLRGIAIPKVTMQSPEFTGAEKKLFMAHRGEKACFGSRLTMHPADLPWLLAEYLPEYCFAIPQPQSASQDWYLKLPGNIILGFASKMRDINDPLRQRDIAEELSKIPDFTGSGYESIDYTLVCYSVYLSDKFMLACEGKSGFVVKSQRKGRRPLVGAAVPKVVVVSPVHVGGLPGLVTEEVASLLRNLCVKSSDGSGNRLQSLTKAVVANPVG